jgi:hypothetical protein
MEAGLQVPETPSTEVPGRAGAVEFWQSGPIWVNVGVIWVAIVMFMVAVVPHCPAAGVNVYVVAPRVAVLIVTGAHVPVIPSMEVPGRAGAAEFWQNGPIWVNVGVTWVATVILMVAVVPHCPASGVNVYVVAPRVAVLIVAGAHVPEMLSSELVGNTGATEFWQSGPIWVNVGVTWAATVMLIVAVVPHCPAAGVNVYVVAPRVVVLIAAGAHVPVMPSREVPERAGAAEFWQSGPIWVNVGVTWAATVMLIVAVVPHCPAAGVNVYVVAPRVVVLMVAGAHVPVMPSREVPGRAGAAEFWQSGPICVNVGVTWVAIVILIVAVVPHCPAAGVNV